MQNAKLITLNNTFPIPKLLKCMTGHFWTGEEFFVAIYKIYISRFSVCHSINNMFEKKESKANGPMGGGLYRRLHYFLKGQNVQGFFTCGNYYFYIKKWTLKMYTSSVEWFFFTWYGRKVDFSRPFSIECRK